MTRQQDGDQPKDAPGQTLYLSPYELWNFGDGKPYAFPGIRKWSNYITALAEIPREPPSQLAVSGTVAAAPLSPKWWLPTLWAKEKLTFAPFVVEKPFGVPSPQELQDILSSVIDQFTPAFFPLDVEAKFVDIDHPRFRVAFPVPDCAMHHELPTKPADPDYDCEDLGIGEDKHITVVAVIDDGLPFAHRNFRDAEGRTRVEFCWLQSAEVEENQKTVLFGREYDRDRINGLIEQYGDDEDWLYRKAGATLDAEELSSLLFRHTTHGAHVMDLAAGYAAECGEVAPREIRIIAVQLPNTIAWDTSGFGKDMYMLSAFHYIFHRADIIAAKYGVEKLRLVINFSYGFSGGRHDGGTELEAAIDELVGKRRARGCPTALVLPAGNTFLEGMHGRISPSDSTDAFKVGWRIQPNNRTPSYLELWFGEGFNPAGYTIEIFDPWDRSRFSKLIQVHETTKPGEDPMQSGIMQEQEGDTTPIGQITVDKHRRQRWRVLVVLAPTEPEDASLPRVECGEWTIVVTRGENAPRLDKPIDCWIQRAADPGSLRSGSRQSYFGDPKNIRYTPEGSLNEEDTDGAFVHRFGSLNGLATGKTSLVVGGYGLGAGLGSGLGSARPSRYSSAGALNEKKPSKQVDCSSMSDRSRVLPRTVAAGVRSGSLSLVQGTSSAAPFVARQLAETFVTAEETVVQPAKDNNYLSLLRGYEPGAQKTAAAASRNGFGCHEDDPKFIKARLGTMLVPPHRQPGIESRAYDQKGASKNTACD